MYAIRLPSGDQAGCMPWAISLRPVPSALITYTPYDGPANAIRRPSGDQDGWLPSVSLVTSDPSAFAR